MKKIVSALGVSALGLGSSFLASPALAVTLADCGTAPTGGSLTLSGSVCTLTFDEAGEYSFTTPDAVTGLQALLVGGGDGADASGSVGYAGGAGEVIYVPLSTVGSGEVFTITVGAAGTSDSRDGGDTVITKTGGTSDTAVGGLMEFVGDCILDSNPNSYYVTFGPGAGGASTNVDGECGRGPGVNPSLSAVDSNGLATPDLFFDYNFELGLGGVVLPAPATLPALTAGSGASIVFNTVDRDPVEKHETAGSGLVVFRWTIAGASESLANTGSDSSGLLGLGAVAIATGAALTVARRRPQGRHSA